MITVLFLAADPVDAPRLRLGQEARDIGEMLQLGKYRDRFRLEQRFSVRARDLIQAMLDLEPQIVHFSGHGNSNGEICLEGVDGKIAAAKPEAVADLFKQFPGRVGCVLLNACNSEAQARAIAPYVGYAIGMNQPILDGAALAFAAGFYQALAAGKKVPQAFEIARAGIGLQGIEGQSVPILVIGTERPQIIVRAVAHLPVVVVVGGSTDDFRTMTRDAFAHMSRYQFSLDSYAQRFNLDQADFSLYEPEWVPAEPKGWGVLLKKIFDLMGRLNRQVPGPKIYHFFLKAPTGLAVGLGACLGVKREAVLEHYQPGFGDSDYMSVLDLTGDVGSGSGADIVRRGLPGPPRHISVTGLEQAKGKIYASIRFATNDPAKATAALAERDGASFVEIKSVLAGDILPDADWLEIARELNTVLLGITGGGACSELHLFLSVPMPLALTIGMGLDTRSPVVIHQWHTRESAYGEIFRLNQLGSLGGG